MLSYSALGLPSFSGCVASDMIALEEEGDEDLKVNLKAELTWRLKVNGNFVDDFGVVDCFRFSCW